MQSLSRTARLLEAMLRKLTSMRMDPQTSGAAEKAGSGASQGKKEQKPAADADVDAISKISLRIGKILSCTAHPDATSLLVEEVDLGEDAPRTICSGLAKHYADPKELVGKKVVVVANLEAKNLRGIRSHGMLLCASSENKETVELLEAPQECVPGTLLRFPVCEGEPLPVLKKKLIKHWESVAPQLHTDDNGVAMYKSYQFLTSFGPIRSCSLKNAPIS
ncbi:hypothetical protein XU18_4269 [Perkinsela sp. CCAP 1560/4]|nr:hypothetical protein XU18_4269 [Perkinsela sp. CCAP 1560/4]|eukprot:KNH04499.1 hypothetical protein XU18_4269 [Perkinsela sp. CCAP 1560/4]